MPLPAPLRRFNRVVTNRLLGPLAERLPKFAVLLHQGRSSGRLYRTPLNVFPVENGFLIALTYGRDVDWAKNLLAAREAALVHRGRTVEVTDPRFVDPDEGRAALPGPVRLITGLVGVRDFIRVSRAS